MKRQENGGGTGLIFKKERNYGQIPPSEAFYASQSPLNLLK